ncbi:hypothetical protein [Rhizobium sp. L9]|uniref:hypothetical protein n=1 Tax=Rhizobium sp. L9 TaxID=1340738 RepID=UPI001FE1649E|nr:hypothetical protein [Rhizobium sp. L9]
MFEHRRRCISICNELPTPLIFLRGPKRLLDEFKAFADGKPVKVEILDLEKPVSAELVWSWKKGTITGKADVGGKTIDVKTKLTFKGDKACSAGKGEKPSCHFILY